MPARKYMPEHYQAMFRLWNEGLGVAQIADKIGMARGSRSEISKFLRAKGVPPDDIVQRGRALVGASKRIYGSNEWKRGDITYTYITRPLWFTGGDSRTNRYRVPEHQVVYCEANNLTEVPKGYVIHHINHNSLDNSIDNLVMLTQAEHCQVHLQDARAYVKWLEERVTEKYPLGIPTIK